VVLKAHEIIPVLTIADIRLRRGLDKTIADALRTAMFCIDSVEL